MASRQHKNRNTILGRKGVLSLKTEYDTDEYRVFRRKYLMELRKRKRSAGICQKCASPAEPGKTHCRKHLEQHRLSDKCRRKKNPLRIRSLQKTKYYKKISRGLCVRCSRPALPGKTLCEKHRLIYANKSRRNNEKQRKKYLTEKRCMRCGTPLDELEIKQKRVTCVDCSSHVTKNIKNR